MLRCQGHVSRYADEACVRRSLGANAHPHSYAQLWISREHRFVQGGAHLC